MRPCVIYNELRQSLLNRMKKPTNQLGSRPGFILIVFKSLTLTLKVKAYMTLNMEHLNEKNQLLKGTCEIMKLIA